MRRFGLVGKTLKHSFSKKYFTDKFKSQGIRDCSYQNFELQDNHQLEVFLKNIPGLEGFNITFPYKEAVLPFLDQYDLSVKEIGACNCVKIQDGKLLGFNTDSQGFRQSLQQHLKSGFNKALVLGTGGASKAVCHALMQLGISFQLVSRKSGPGMLNYHELTEPVMLSHNIIINTTPLGTFPDVNDAPPIPYSWLSPRHLLFDLVYNPGKTKFMDEGEKMGAQIVNGYEMLVLQAEESWRIWNDDSL